MTVDVETAIEIDRARSAVAAYASDLGNTTSWYKNIESVEWKTKEHGTIGSRATFTARFLGRRLIYTYEIREFVEGARLVMITAQGPFPMSTTYTWEDTPSGRTKMVLRNRGEPAGFSKVAAPMMERAMRRATSNDLSRLKAILESGDFAERVQGNVTAK